jgi:hypothetical protein
METVNETVVELDGLVSKIGLVSSRNATSVA